MRDFCLLLLFFTCISCTSGMDPKQDVLNWVKNSTSELTSISEQNGIRYELQYIPPMYRAVLDHPNAPMEHLDSLAAADSVMEYYTLKLSIAGKRENLYEARATNKRDKDALEYYFSFKMQDNIILSRGNLKLTPVLFHYEKSFGLRIEETFVLGFDVGRSADSRSVLRIEPNLLGEEPVKLAVNALKDPAIF